MNLIVFMSANCQQDGREDLFGYKRGEIDSTADSHGAFSTERGITTEPILDEHRPATIPVVGYVDVGHALC